MISSAKALSSSLTESLLPGKSFSCSCTFKKSSIKLLSIISSSLSLKDVLTSFSNLLKSTWSAVGKVNSFSCTVLPTTGNAASFICCTTSGVAASILFNSSLVASAFSIVICCNACTTAFAFSLCFIAY